MLILTCKLVHKKCAGGAVQLLLPPENITINLSKKRSGEESVRAYINGDEEKQSHHLHTRIDGEIWFKLGATSHQISLQMLQPIVETNVVVELWGHSSHGCISIS
jgi:hypothetical protein